MENNTPICIPTKAQRMGSRQIVVERSYENAEVILVRMCIAVFRRWSHCSQHLKENRRKDGLTC